MLVLVGHAIVRAVAEVEEARGAMGEWKDPVARLSVPAVLLPAGLDAVRAWARCWHAIAFATGAADGEMHAAESQCYMTAAEQARTAVDACSLLPTGAWTDAVRALQRECRVRAVLAGVKTIQKGHPASVNVGKTLGALKHIDGDVPETMRTAVDAATAQLTEDNARVYFAQVETGESAMPATIDIPCPADVEPLAMTAIDFN
jgi:hypothetical protein